MVYETVTGHLHVAYTSHTSTRRVIIDNKDIDTPDGPSIGDEEPLEDVQLLQLSATLAKFYSVNVKSTDKNLIADCLQCKKSYSASTYEDIVTEFGIRGKVRKVVADNALSMVRAFDCCSIVAAVCRSTVAAPFLEKIGVSLQAANATRWNSQLTMLKSVLKDVNGVNSAIRLLRSCKTVEELNGMEIAMLKEVIKVLELFKEGTSQVEGENMVTISCVAPVVFGLEHSLKLLKESKPIYCLNLANALQSSIKKMLYPFLEKTDVIAAAVMDPRFKLAWLPCEEIKKEKISKIVDLIISESTRSSLKTTIPEREPFITISTNQDKADMSAKRPRLFACMPPAAKINVSAPTSDTTVVKAELELYLEGFLAFDGNPLRYWRENKSFSILKPFSRNILGCCATSAPSESVFSKAGNFYTPERAKLGPETFRALMMIKCNYDI
ncbi:zinc finger BED domain-containing protein 4-like [Palaemon carinicauda]|uniref:zinc finger BED domain-containing protein 4-like n=1 Tax=Palaemon carinicauda TaxID=392227 RepID=UPI0035B6895B